MEKWKWKNVLTFVGAVKNCFVTLKINPINQTTEMCVFVIFNFDTSNFWPEINFSPEYICVSVDIPYFAILREKQMDFFR